MKERFLRIVSVCAALSGAAVLAQIDVGKPAAEVEPDQVLNCAVPFGSTKDLQGAALLLEYWATW